MTVTDSDVNMRLKSNSKIFIKSLNDINCIHNNEVNNIAECNLPYFISSYYKRTKNINRHYLPILHRCMNTCRRKYKCKSFCILLDSGCSSTIVMIILMKILKTKKYDVMQ